MAFIIYKLMKIRSTNIASIEQLCWFNFIFLIFFNMVYQSTFIGTI